MKQIEKAAELLSNAYAPYSKFRVGCVVVTETGKEYGGCNIENASFSATVCAERVAIGQAIAAGETTISKVYLITSSDRPCFPCGVCLQVISEFGTEVEVISSSYDQKTIRKFQLQELLPHPFNVPSKIN